ncbi:MULTISPECIES: PRC-barrel domain-containing protein [Oceanobacillus]|uniref:PRC-barrel domain containing protein n=1 Tax=Oceanobacillus profundus TaxID=372463 RepID=A0A417YLG7_9BACI|nr:PRC-barrel domain-containing protein [Oceanobacillus profundus]MCM3399368.1 PRC-barrel domain-containing protein [Oceanobacillus profundus]RHW34329.1 PRC-barrel domain containing protein [Oceanobacillus profundus]
MMRLTSQLKQFNIHATDGELGKIKDFYFDDRNWEIRYAIVDTRKWLPGRKVLLSPNSFIEVDETNESVNVEFDKLMIRNSPPVPENEDLTKDKENHLIDYFGWNSYTDNALPHAERGLLGTFPIIGLENERPPEEPHLNRNGRYHEHDNYLRSEEETNDFKVHAKDGKIGRIVDMIYDTSQWIIEYIVVRSSKSIVENEFYIFHTRQINTVDWFEKDLYINDSLEGILNNKPFQQKEEILVSFE